MSESVIPFMLHWGLVLTYPRAKPKGQHQLEFLAVENAMEDGELASIFSQKEFILLTTKA